MEKDACKLHFRKRERERERERPPLPEKEKYQGSWTESNGFRWRVSLSVAKPGGCGRGVARRGGLLDHFGAEAQLFETT